MRRFKIQNESFSKQSVALCSSSACGVFRCHGDGVAPASLFDPENNSTKRPHVKVELVFFLLECSVLNSCGTIHPQVFMPKVASHQRLQPIS